MRLVNNGASRYMKSATRNISFLCFASFLLQILTTWAFTAWSTETQSRAATPIRWSSKPRRWSPGSQSKSLLTMTLSAVIRIWNNVSIFLWVIRSSKHQKINHKIRDVLEKGLSTQMKLLASAEIYYSGRLPSALKRRSGLRRFDRKVFPSFGCRRGDGDSSPWHGLWMYVFRKYFTLFRQVCDAGSWRCVSDRNPPRGRCLQKATRLSQGNLMVECDYKWNRRRTEQQRFLCGAALIPGSWLGIFP